MATFTAKGSLKKPAGTDVIALSDINPNWDLISTMSGFQWVTDGSDPAVLFHGALAKELTSLKEYVYKDDGVGGYIKTLTGSGKQTWTTIPLAAGYTSQALYPVPQYRILNGMCQLRGTVRSTANIIAAQAAVLFTSGMPIPDGAGSNAFHVGVPAGFWHTTTGLDVFAMGAINPRTDGGIRMYAPIAGGPWNMFGLDGLSYAV